MNESTAKKKIEIRHLIQGKRDALSLKERHDKSIVIAHVLFCQELYKAAETIFIYYPFRSEVNTLIIIQEAQKNNKKIILPRVENNGLQLYYVEDLKTDLLEGAFGIMEPKRTCREVLLKDIDLIVMPGTCFDKQMNRIGYGGGFYDRILESMAQSIPRIALAFDIQVLDSIPTEELDQKVNLIITESKIYYP